MLLQLRSLRGIGDNSTNLNTTIFGADGFGFPGAELPPDEPTTLSLPVSNFAPYLIGAVAVLVALKVVTAGRKVTRGIKRARRKSERRAQLKAQLASL